MRRVWFGAAVGLAVAMGVMLNVQRAVYADSAIVIKNDGECAMPGADENGDFIFGGLGERITVVENDDKVMVKCKGVALINDSGQSQLFTGFGCSILGPDGQVFVADESQATVSAKGNGMMTCTYVK